MGIRPLTTRWVSHSRSEEPTGSRQSLLGFVHSHIIAHHSHGGIGHSMGLLAGKVVAVTGAGRGIGRAVAVLCASEVASVVVNDFGGSTSGEGANIVPANEVVAQIMAAGGHAVANLA